MLRRSAAATMDNFYQLFSRPFGHAVPPHLLWLAVLLFLAVAALLAARLPTGMPGLPQIRPALAVSLAWLLVWPYQYPWYDAMALCLLAVHPMSRLDWAVLARLTAGVFGSLPGKPIRLPHDMLGIVLRVDRYALLPSVRVTVLAVVVLLALTEAWRAREPLSEQSSGACP